MGRPAYITAGRAALGGRRGVADLRERTCAVLDAEVKDHSLAAFTAQLAETEALLGDRLAVHHVRSATLAPGSA